MFNSATQSLSTIPGCSLIGVVASRYDALDRTWTQHKVTSSRTSSALILLTLLRTNSDTACGEKTLNLVLSSTSERFRVVGRSVCPSGGDRRRVGVGGAKGRVIEMSSIVDRSLSSSIFTARRPVDEDHQVVTGSGERAPPEAVVKCLWRELPRIFRPYKEIQPLKFDTFTHTQTDAHHQALS